MVQLLEQGEQNPSQVSRDHHVTRSLLYLWQQLYRERGEAAFVPTQAFQSPRYYEQRRPSAHQQADERLRQAIQGLREDFTGYGYRRITKALVRAGWKINHKRVWRVMRAAHLTCRRKRRTVHTADSKHSYQIYPNLVKGLQVEAPNRCWVAYLTYVRLPEGFVYLACLLDVYSPKCMGWSLSRRIDAQLPLQALEMALAQREVSAGLIHHSDRARQYCSNLYVERLLEVGANISMSTPGQPTDNPFAESFIKTVKCEEVYLHQYRTFEELKHACRRFWRMCTMLNVSIRHWSMFLPMSLKPITSSVNGTVVWISWGHSTAFDVNIDVGFLKC